MSGTARLSIFTLLLAACGGSSDPMDTTPDRDGGAPHDGGVCALELSADVTVRAGARIDFDAREVGGSTIEISWPAAFTVLGADLVRAPYDPGAYPVEVRAACGETSTRTVTVEALEFGAPIEWTVGPDAREHPAMWIDSVEPDALYLLGGFSFAPRQYTVVDDLWRFDLNAEAWTEIGRGPLLAGGRLANVPGRAAFYEGGQSPNQALPFSLVEITASTATASVQTLSPEGAPREGATLHGLVHDEARERLVSFAGFHPNLTTDVFTYDLATNRYAPLAVTGPAPSARYGFFFALDVETDRIIVFSGAQAGVAGNPVNPATDTWALDLSSDPPAWTELLGPADSAPGRRNGCSALDAKNHRLFVWGGTPDARTTQTRLWVLDLDRGHERWTRIDIGDDRVRSSCSAVYDPARERILFGFGNNSQGIYADLTPLDL